MATFTVYPGTGPASIGPAGMIGDDARAMLLTSSHPPFLSADGLMTWPTGWSRIERRDWLDLMNLPRDLDADDVEVPPTEPPVPDVVRPAARAPVWLKAMSVATGAVALGVLTRWL